MNTAGLSRRFRTIVASAACSAALAIAMPVAAAPLLFTFTGSHNGSFQADSDPVPTFIDANSFVAPIGANTGDFTGGGGAEFYRPAGGGGLALYAGPGASVFIGLGGPQLFTGALTSPHFAPGTFQLQDSATSAITSLTISGPGAPAPELGTGLLAGLLGCAALALTRRRRSPEAA